MVAPAEAGGDEAGAEPSNEGVGYGEGEERERERGDQGLAVALEGVCEDGQRRARDGEEGECLGPREFVGSVRRHGYVACWRES